MKKINASKMPYREKIECILFNRKQTVELLILH